MRIDVSPYYCSENSLSYLLSSTTYVERLKNVYRSTSRKSLHPMYVLWPESPYCPSGTVPEAVLRSSFSLILRSTIRPSCITHCPCL